MYYLGMMMKKILKDNFFLDELFISDVYIYGNKVSEYIFL